MFRDNSFVQTGASNFGFWKEMACCLQRLIGGKRQDRNGLDSVVSHPSSNTDDGVVLVIHFYELADL